MASMRTDKGIRRWTGLLWFVPLAYTTFRWLLSMIGDAQTAYTVFQTEWITIDWVVVSHLLAIAGVLWIVCVNWEILQSWRRKRFEKNLVSLSDALRIVVGSNAAKKESEMNKALQKLITLSRTGRVDLYGTPRAQRKVYTKIPRQFWQDMGVFKINRVGNDYIIISAHYCEDGDTIHDSVWMPLKDVARWRNA